MTREEALIHVNKMFDSIFRPSDITDSEWATTKIIFGIITMANTMAESYLESIEMGYTDAHIIKALENEAIEYKPKIKAWIIDQMR